MKTVNKYLSLPRLEKLTIGSQVLRTFDEVDATIQHSSLRILDLGGGHYHIPLETLCAIFKSHPKITSFRGPLFGTRKYNPDYHCTQLEPLLSPLRISHALVPLQNSLEQLQLLLCRCLYNWPGRTHDGTRMDLSMKNNLRILQCPSKCFFPPHVDGVAPSRAGLYMLLPPNLEELTVSNFAIYRLMCITKCVNSSY